MQIRSRRIAVAALAVLSAQPCLAQEATPFTHPETGITFGTWTTPQGSFRVPATFGLVLPSDALTVDATEYIGYMRCTKPTPTSTGWCGLSHGASGQMVGALIVMAWPHGDEVLTSLRWADGYEAPRLYAGNATITQIASRVTDEAYELLYRCQGCLAWNDGGDAGKLSTSQGFLVLGGAASGIAVGNAACPDRIDIGYHDIGFMQFGAVLTGLASESYAEWAALATRTVPGSCGSEPTPPTTTGATTALPTEPATSVPSEPATPTSPVPEPTFTPAPTDEFDYIVVGAGAGGITIADKLSEEGYSVLLIEKGPPSTGLWGGKMGPEWLNGTGLTRFDVPGLCNQIWVDSAGVACNDMDQMAGCVLGGGVAVNAGLWWKPPPLDWDYNFPEGWKSRDMRRATDRVFGRIPGTTRPSTDGVRYLEQGFNVLASGLDASGWARIDNPNSASQRKNRTYGNSVFMFSGGERGGPLATYLKSASERSGFRLITDTAVKRLIRIGGHITGVEIDGNRATGNGYQGVVNVTRSTGRVILSGGVFGTAKVLFRSGIGPADALSTVKNSASDGATMIGEQSWIDLPVGYNLVDHVNTDAIVSHPDVVYYDFYEAWDSPPPTDAERYLTNRTGILAQAAPNIGPVFWEEIKGADGIVRQMQWTARVEGLTSTSMVVSMYLGRGSTSRGRMSVTSRLDTRVVTAPYLHDNNDRLAIIESLDNIRQSLGVVQNLTFLVPGPNQSSAAYVNSLLTTPAQRRANHWMGTAKMGTDDGRSGGTAVVDVNTKVYGTDNLFVVDASIFPGMVTGNPSAMIVIAAEHAATKIMSLGYTAAGREGERCGGRRWNGSFRCSAGLECRFLNENVSRCLAPGSTPSERDQVERRETNI